MQMEKDSSKTWFQEYIDYSIPVAVKCTRKVVIRKEAAQRIVNHFKGTPDVDGAFQRHFVMVDLQVAGIKKRIRSKKRIRYYTFVIEQ